MSVISDVNYLQMDYSLETFKNELLSLNIKDKSKTTTKRKEVKRELVAV